MLVLSVLFVASCGNNKHESSPTTNFPQNENEPVSGKSRYSEILIEENCGFWTDCDFTVRSELNRRPVILDAGFVDNVGPEIGECNFQVILSDPQADRLEVLADQLRFCQVDNFPDSPDGFDGLFASTTSGKEFMVSKKDLCAGRTKFYNYLKTLILPKAPETCPSSYLRLF